MGKMIATRLALVLETGLWGHQGVELIIPRTDRLKMDPGPSYQPFLGDKYSQQLVSW